MINAIEKRKSIRSFENRKVELEKIDNILHAAMRAPSASNVQPWEFLVINDEQLLESMNGFSRGAHAMKTAKLVIVVLMKKIPQREAMNLTSLSYEDLGACTENLWLQAIEEGLGVSWMGIAPDSDDETALCKLLNLPEDLKVFSVMAVGYPSAEVDLNPVDRYDSARIHYNNYK